MCCVTMKSSTWRAIGSISRLELGYCRIRVSGCASCGLCPVSCAPLPTTSRDAARRTPLEILWTGGERQAQRRVQPLANHGRQRCLHVDLGLVGSPYKSALLRSSYLWSYPVRLG